MISDYHAVTNVATDAHDEADATTMTTATTGQACSSYNPVIHFERDIKLTDYCYLDSSIMNSGAPANVQGLSTVTERVYSPDPAHSAEHYHNGYAEHYHIEQKKTLLFDATPFISALREVQTIDVVRRTLDYDDTVANDSAIVSFNAPVPFAIYEHAICSKDKSFFPKSIWDAFSADLQKHILDFHWTTVKQA